MTVCCPDAEKLIDKTNMTRNLMQSRASSENMPRNYNRVMAQIYGECPHCGMKGVVRSEMESIFMAR